MAREVHERLAGLDAAAAVETHTMGEIFTGASLPSRVGAAIPGGFAKAASVSRIAVLATVAPTARALRVDPAVALRHE
jgi:molybdopterin biosynthesis enzyme